MIQTLPGPVARGELGLTYVHEHILTRPTDWRIAAFLAEASSRCIDLVPFMAKLRILRQWTGLCDSHRRVTMAELVATGRVSNLIALFALDRFERDRAVSERASAETH